MNVIKNLYLTDRFFIILLGILVVFAIGYAWAPLYYAAHGLLILSLAVLATDVFLLFYPGNTVTAERTTPNLLSLGDENRIFLEVTSRFNLTVNCRIIDELPEQLQVRDFELSLRLKPDEQRQLDYSVRPVVRGAYHFGFLNVFVQNFLGLARRRVHVDIRKTVPVYPSVIQMKQYELQAFTQHGFAGGIKKIRRIGHNYEFEQIRNYARGDDYRSINWKATSRRSELMVNQYQDEKAQQIYTIIDKSRSMLMPFEGMSLLDYAINTSLSISNTALLKQDKAGLLTFADKINAFVPADRRKGQLKKIMDVLYNQKEHNTEGNFELLFHGIRRQIKRRSLLLLYTNFESAYAAERVLPLLRKLNQQHLLVVIFFENTELFDISRKDSETIEDIYIQTIAQKFIFEKKHIIKEFTRYGIQSILTTPKQLTIDSINKYLELKARRLI